MSHVVLVPAKPPAAGKTRLRGLPDGVRRDLAEAFALDTVAACLATDGVDHVMAVTDDAGFARRLAAMGCAVLPDGVADDLNGTLVQAAVEAARRWPVSRVAAVCADLPALRPADLALALRRASSHAQAFVADAEATGTTCYVADLGAFRPAFGPDSRTQHLALGAVEIRDDTAGDLASLRRDVDDLEDLEEAHRLGLGPQSHLRNMQRGWVTGR
ncbi:2-phospho-L-lactate guanylyltransferase [Nocardioides sp. GCM10027113]|uniref:2-phospho-L-lactate guanylyltransferase n=1 Tax=unclassified Nocardioides TaxID=2615069 RepID=UPI0036069538